MPGIGPITALGYRAMVDDPTRFKRSRSVGAYVGLTTRRHASGAVDLRRRAIGKRAINMDPPASPNAIYGGPSSDRGENSGPGRHITESLTPIPELENVFWLPFSMSLRAFHGCAE